ncbi:MAG: 16S rRNA (adenine(1518)-N(6)/adenine(1519)-N(6))-dimethyltransferase RsmA [Pseudomonadota bacterium]|nr:16S rRNA (adenine(1518)-N(6)/adenine(1519)-N(6))-dimethyltransferase RsmA [Pseudomonadota bacterium]
MARSFGRELEGLPTIKQVILDNDLSARKSLGQHFLLDDNVIARIVNSAAIDGSMTVLEIGPGPGGLTRALLASPAKGVVAIERDERSVDALRDLVHVVGSRFHLITGDALALDLDSLCGQPFQIVANLPYNIGTKLVLVFLHMLHKPKRMTLMLQKEVAQRMIASPGGKDYGRLSIIVQWLAQARVLFDVPARAFKPEPKVTSSVIELIPRSPPLAEAEPNVLELITQTAFSQRRKMLRVSLKKIHPDVIVLLEKAGVSPAMRPEELTIQEFCSIAREFSSWSETTAI